MTSKEIELVTEIHVHTGKARDQVVSLAKATEYLRKN